MKTIPVIPNTITVHLGPPDKPAENVTVPFVDYIKNVVSSEIYPTWNYDAIVANTLAITSFALNRVYTEFYPSRGKNFDITSSTAIDQKFVKDRNIFNNVSKIVDDFYYMYVRRKGNIEPLATKFCNGTTVTCNGLSQWGSEYMARGGSSYMDILYSYYGRDIELVTNAPIKDIKYSYAGVLNKGDSGLPVRRAQVMLNRVSNAYPSIPKVDTDGKYGPRTEKSVRKFQELFNLQIDGIIGKATWYELVRLYVGLNRLNELNSLGQKYFDVSLSYPEALKFGDRGKDVKVIQYYVNVIAENYGYLRPISIDGIYGNDTVNAVKTFQRVNGMQVDGIVGKNTWNRMYNAVSGAINMEREVDYRIDTELSYPGFVISEGDRGDNVLYIQTRLNEVAKVFNTAFRVAETGFFGNDTKNSVLRFQQSYGLEQTGSVDKITWNELNQEYYNAMSIDNNQNSQIPYRTLNLFDEDRG